MESRKAEPSGSCATPQVGGSLAPPLWARVAPTTNSLWSHVVPGFTSHPPHSHSDTLFGAPSKTRLALLLAPIDRTWPRSNASCNKSFRTKFLHTDSMIDAAFERRSAATPSDREGFASWFVQALRNRKLEGWVHVKGRYSWGHTGTNRFVIYIYRRPGFLALSALLFVCYG